MSLMLENDWSILWRIYFCLENVKQIEEFKNCSSHSPVGCCKLPDLGWCHQMLRIPPRSRPMIYQCRKSWFLDHLSIWIFDHKVIPRYVVVFIIWFGSCIRIVTILFLQDISEEVLIFVHPTFTDRLQYSPNEKLASHCMFATCRL